VTLRLCSIALDNWPEVDGLAVSLNMPRLSDLPLDRFCNFMQWWVLRLSEDSTERAKFNARLWRPPPGAVPDKRSPWSAANEMKAFEALKRGLGK
jgi:hypothetical protein